jgi:hypothetical protein
MRKKEPMMRFRLICRFTALALAILAGAGVVDPPVDVGDSSVCAGLSGTIACVPPE